MRHTTICPSNIIILFSPLNRIIKNIQMGINWTVKLSCRCERALQRLAIVVQGQQMGSLSSSLTSFQSSTLTHWTHQTHCALLPTDSTYDITAVRFLLVRQFRMCTFNFDLIWIDWGLILKYTAFYFVLYRPITWYFCHWRIKIPGVLISHAPSTLEWLFPCDIRDVASVAYYFSLRCWPNQFRISRRTLPCWKVG